MDYSNDTWALVLTASSLNRFCYKKGELIENANGQILKDGNKKSVEITFFL